MACQENIETCSTTFILFNRAAVWLFDHVSCRCGQIFSDIV